MHVVLRALSLAFLLLSVSSGAASAMDPSATEETNRLMACDANQEHCASTLRVTAPGAIQRTIQRPRRAVRGSRLS